MAMNTEKIYESAYFLLQDAVLEATSAEELGTEMEKAMADLANYKLRRLNSKIDAAATILVECKAEMAKATVKPSLYRGVHNIYNSCSDALANYYGRYTDEEGRMCVCNGYHGVRLNTVVEDIPECVGGDLTRPYKEALEYTELLTLPTMKELSAHIKEHNAKERLKKPKARRPATYDFGEGKPLVNANYLMNLLNIFGEDCKVTFGGRISSPIYFVSDIGDGVIMPINKERYRKAA